MTVANRHSFVLISNRYRHAHRIKLFPATGPLEFVAMDIKESLSKTTKDIQYILVKIDRCSKLTRAISTSKKTFSYMKNAFLDLWIVLFGIHANLWMDIGPQLLRKFFSSISGYQRLKRLATTAYYLQTNIKAKRYKRIIVERLRKYVKHHQRHWDLFLQLFKYAYNTKVHRSTNTLLYSFILSHHPPRPLLLSANTIKPRENISKTSP